MLNININIVELIPHLPFSRQMLARMALHSRLSEYDLCSFRDDAGNVLVALYLGNFEVCIDGCRRHIIVDAHKIKESCTARALAREGCNGPAPMV